MAWSIGIRDIFASLPPADLLPPEAAELAEKHRRFVAEAKDLNGQARAKEKERQQVIHGYEASLADAMVAGRKPPISPLPDYEAALADLRHRAGGAHRAAGTVYAQLGDLMNATQSERIAESTTSLSESVEQAHRMLADLETVLDLVGTRLAVTYWFSAVGPSTSPGYNPVTPEGASFDKGLTELRKTLDDLRNRIGPNQQPQTRRSA